MIAIIDYGLGNTGSILNMCKHTGINAVVTDELNIIKKASHLILPGVGTFDNGILQLRRTGLDALVTEMAIGAKTPILGICLGAQLMLCSSEEGSEEGLSWVQGKVRKFQANNGIKVPHMGWNNVFINGESALFEGMPENPPRFYFVHSYYFELENEAYKMSITDYGSEFVSSFRVNNILGVQFHPEKSHKFGMQFLSNFSKI